MAEYETITNYNRTIVVGDDGSRGWVMNLFPMDVGFNAFVVGADAADEFIGHFTKQDDAVAAVVARLGEEQQ